jgi:hypothetical protein
MTMSTDQRQKFRSNLGTLFLFTEGFFARRVQEYHASSPISAQKRPGPSENAPRCPGRSRMPSTITSWRRNAFHDHGLQGTGYLFDAHPSWVKFMITLLRTNWSLSSPDLPVPARAISSKMFSYRK